MGPLSFIKGTNYGNIFIPEDFFSNNEFMIPNGIEKVYDKYSLCDLHDNKTEAMTNWLDSQIKEEHFI